MPQELQQVVVDVIDGGHDLFQEIGHSIWKRPELAFEEKHAHDFLSNALQDAGFEVQKNYVLPTAFRAEFKGRAGSSPTVAILCEYDALPEIGHACGHNLIAEAGFAAGVALKAALEADSTMSGKVVVLGTPAEEGGGGKVYLIDGGAFKDIDVCLMSHPSTADLVFTPFIAISRMTVSYKGKAAHASGFPWEGINALDAAVLCYNNISVLRQQIRPTCRIHGVITKGGTVPNIIPAETELKYYARAPDEQSIQELQDKMEACFHAAAKATQCEVSISYDKAFYKHLITNKKLAELYKIHAEAYGIQFHDGDPKVVPFVASSDVGNVSHVVPTIQPCYSIGTSAPNHSVAFTEASGATRAQGPTLISAKAMALTGLEVIRNPKVLQEVRQCFEQDMVNH